MAAGVVAAAETASLKLGSHGPELDIRGREV